MLVMSPRSFIVAGILCFVVKVSMTRSQIGALVQVYGSGTTSKENLYLRSVDKRFLKVVANIKLKKDLFLGAWLKILKLKRAVLFKIWLFKKFFSPLNKLFSRKHSITLIGNFFMNNKKIAAKKKVIPSRRKVKLNKQKLRTTGMKVKLSAAKKW